jgi:predicted  nucleic acid-binding Zn-ribbon protein
MPHKCTGCGRQFADGSKEMLSGCPDCGGTKFQFMPAGGAPAAEEPPEPPGTDAGAVAETMGAATAKLRDFVGDDPGPQRHGSGAEATRSEARSAASDEDGAQSAARSEMVSQQELPGNTPRVADTGCERADGSAVAESSPEGEPVDGEADGRVVDTPSEDQPDLSELREELNDQFEGIRIRETGQYELNLMELYEREETIIALKENGRYVIEPPESWHGD